MRVTVLAGGVGAARFLSGLVHLRTAELPELEVTVIGNTGDDVRMYGLQVCPDLDSIMYCLAGVSDPDRGWGRADETFATQTELNRYGAVPDWFTLGDRDLATHIWRSHLLDSGYPLSAVTLALTSRWDLPVRLLPMTDDRVETHVVTTTDEGSARAVHFQEWWVRWGARIPARDFLYVQADQAQPAPGVLDAITEADLIFVAPSNPIVSIGPILAIAPIREALTRASAAVVGVSPIVGDGPLRGMADVCLRARQIPVSATGVALHYGSRETGGVIDYWIVDDQDSAQVPAIEAAGIASWSMPTIFDTPVLAAAVAREVIERTASER